MYRDKKLYRDKALILIQVRYVRQVPIAGQVRLDISLTCGINDLSRYKCLFRDNARGRSNAFSLPPERTARLNEPSNTLESEGDGHSHEEISCEKVLERFGENYVKELTGFADAQVIEVLEACRETLNQLVQVGATEIWRVDLLLTWCG